MKTIKLYGKLAKNRFAIIDDDKEELINKYRWTVKEDSNNSYAKCYDKKRCIAMHRLILGITDSSIQVDHINHDGLDNRIENLRICSANENQFNQSKQKRKEFKGVYLKYITRTKKIRWGSQIKYRGTKYYLGTYDTELDAAKAYDKKAEELFGEFACTNKSMGLY